MGCLDLYLGSLNLSLGFTETKVALLEVAVVVGCP